MNTYPESEFSDPSWTAQLERAMKEQPAEPSSPPRSRDDYLALLREEPDGEQIIDKVSAASAFATLNDLNRWRNQGFSADFHGVVQQGWSWALLAHVNHAPLPTRLECPGIQVGGLGSGTRFGVLIETDGYPGMAVWAHEGFWRTVGTISPGRTAFQEFRRRNSYPTPSLYFAVVNRTAQIRAVHITRME